MRSVSPRRSGFTLVELLVVIGIIAILMAILLPSLQRARQSATALKAANNARSIGQGLLVYINENRGWFPAAYNYRDSYTYMSTDGQLKMEGNKLFGYIHWSAYIAGTVNPEAFQNPSTKDGGLVPSFPMATEIRLGQVPAAALSGSLPALTAAKSPLTASLLADVEPQSAVLDGATKNWYPDAQAPILGYTVNEALFCRPKYAVGFDGTLTPSVNANVSAVKNHTQTIMVCEFPSQWQIVSGKVGSSTPDLTVKSHRPVQPFVVNGAIANSMQDIDKDPGSPADLTCTTATNLTDLAGGKGLRRTNAADLWRTSAVAPGTATYSYDLGADAEQGTYDANGTSRVSRLDWVGRNQPGEGSQARDNKSVFVYVDGHVETKHIFQTIPAKATDAGPWEWGDKCYTIPGAKVVLPENEVN